MIWEVISSEWANTIFKIFMIAINTVVVMVLGNASIIHMNIELGAVIVGICCLTTVVPEDRFIVPDAFANTIL